MKLYQPLDLVRADKHIGPIVCFSQSTGRIAVQLWHRDVPLLLQLQAYGVCESLFAAGFPLTYVHKLCSHRCCTLPSCLGTLANNHAVATLGRTSPARCRAFDAPKPDMLRCSS